MRRHLTCLIALAMAASLAAAMIVVVPASASGSLTGGPSTESQNSGAPTATLPNTQMTSKLKVASLTVNLDQWANGGTTSSAGWQNGDLNGNNSAYPEGGVVPFRLAIEGLTTGQHTIDLVYQFTAGGHKAYDFLATYNATENPGLCASGGGAVSSMCPSLGAASTAPFPTDASGEVHNAEVAFGSNRNLTIYGGTIASLSPVTYSGGSNGSATIHVTFNATGSAVLLTWGGHLARSVDYASGGCGQISGAPWHMATQNLDGTGNKNQDRSIQASAIIKSTVTPTSTPTATVTNTPIPSATSTFTATVTNTPTAVATNTPVLSAANTPTPTTTTTPVPGAPNTPAATNTSTPVPMAPNTTPASTPTSTPSSSSTSTGASPAAATPIPMAIIGTTTNPNTIATPAPSQSMALVGVTLPRLPQTGGMAPLAMALMGLSLTAIGGSLRRRL